MTQLAVQLSMLVMNGRRRASTPSNYRREFISRTRSARVMSGKSQQQVADEIGIKLNTYQTWETRTLMAHQCIIPFCQATGADPYFLLTGTPFSLGRAPSAHRRADA